MNTTTETKLIVPPDEAEALRKIIVRDGLKVRPFSQGLINKATLTFRINPASTTSKYPPTLYWSNWIARRTISERLGC